MMLCACVHNITIQKCCCETRKTKVSGWNKSQEKTQINARSSQHWHYSVEQRQTNHKFTTAHIKIPWQSQTNCQNNHNSQTQARHEDLSLQLSFSKFDKFSNWGKTYRKIRSLDCTQLKSRSYPKNFANGQRLAFQVLQKLHRPSTESQIEF